MISYDVLPFDLSIGAYLNFLSKSKDKVVAMDCEMVGVGPTGTRSVLARVSIVDSEGNVLVDKRLGTMQTVKLAAFSTVFIRKDRTWMKFHNLY